MSVLIVDGNSVRGKVCRGVVAAQHEALEATSLVDALDLLGTQSIDVVLVDWEAMEGSLDPLLSIARTLDNSVEVVVLAESNDSQDVVSTIKSGAFHYLVRPVEPEVLLKTIEDAAAKVGRVREERRRRIGKLSQQEEGWDAKLVGESMPMVRVKERILVVGQTDATVLITGQSGTGKELVARALQQVSSRSNRPFVPVNCGAIPENLQEAEFFGHVRGAFTGAVRDRKGLFEEANGGTLFLDEIGETALQTQVKLLRFLQEGEIRKVGGDSSIHLDVRLIAATNRDLKQLIAERRFREDLYYRLNIIGIELPPLRKRPSDIPALAWEFLRRHRLSVSRSVMGFSPEALDVLTSCPWPGNVRELENAIQHALAMGTSSLIQPEDLPLDATAGPSSPEMLIASSPSFLAVQGAGNWNPNYPMYSSGSDLLRITPTPSGGFPAVASITTPGGNAAVEESQQVRTLDRIEGAEIRKALEIFDGHRGKMAKALGISKTTLWRKLKKMGLEP